MHRSRKVEYHVRVEHSPELFQDDMNFSTKDPAEALNQYLSLSQKYGAKRVIVEKVIQTTSREELSQEQLELIVSG